MSFSSEVREELSRQTDSARHCRIALLSAMFHLAPVLTEDTAGICTDSEPAAAAFEGTLKKVTDAPVTREYVRGRKSTRIMITVRGRRQVRSLLEMLKLDGTGGDGGPDAETVRTTPPARVLLQKTCCRKAYLRGAFLLSGSVSDPAKSYHLEIVLPREEDAATIASVMESLGFGARVTKRKSRSLVYLKEGEQISDILGAMGATGSLMKLENARILRDIAGNINRQVNFEAANLRKTALASDRQAEEIRYIRDTAGLDSLPQPLRQAAMLRLRMPDASLRELAEASDPPVGRSGMNHRLQRLMETAADLRSRRNEL